MIMICIYCGKKKYKFRGLPGRAFSWSDLERFKSSGLGQLLPYLADLAWPAEAL